MQTAALPTSEQRAVTTSIQMNSKKSATSPTSASSNDMNARLKMHHGELKATVLSLYDLPTRDQPSYIKITACGKSVQSGAPTSRHKDRNSFKFGTPGVNNQVVIQAGDLSSLYQSHMMVEVVYDQKPSWNLRASYALNQLHVHEPTWLVLTLEAPNNNNNNNTTSNASNSADSTNGGLDVPPTIRIKVQLAGPYRSEMAALLTVCQAWFGFMDRVEDSTSQILAQVPVPHNKGWLLVPAVPLATAAVVIAPIVTGLAVVFLPVFVPLLAAILTVASCLLGTGYFLYASTSRGRAQLTHLVAPLASTLLDTPSGQCLLYQTGPRPTPVSLARVVLPTGLWGRLVVSLCIDLIGNGSYLVPGVGELVDVGWAPLQTVLIMAMYDSTTPNLKYLSFVEELLPFTDFVPSATIGWAAQFGPQLLQGGNALAIPTDLTLKTK